MASRGRRKSAGVVEMAPDLGVSTTTVSRALNATASLCSDDAGYITGQVIGVNGGNYT
jgi:hypothetical protein